MNSNVVFYTKRKKMAPNIFSTPERTPTGNSIDIAGGVG